MAAGHTARDPVRYSIMAAEWLEVKGRLFRLIRHGSDGLVRSAPLWRHQVCWNRSAWSLQMEN